MSRSLLHTNEVYHVYNRGVDKREIFLTKEEYTYFIHLLYTFNDSDNSINTKRKYERSTHIVSDSTHTDKRNRLVDILAFCLMPNHFHLLLKQRTDNGIPKFMQKVGTGYTMFFNEKYKRSGSLFQGIYKRVHIEDDRQFLYIPHYIHLNPFSLIDRGQTSINDKLDFLEGYRWSSYCDFIGKRNLPSVTERSLVLDIFGGPTKYKEDLEQFVSNNTQFEQFDTKVLVDI